MIDHSAVLLACRAHARTLEVATTTGSYARASTATYTDVNGVVQTAAVDEFRSAHYVNGVLTPLYEAAGTNLCLRSDAFDHATWTSVGSPSVSANAVTAPDGTLTADTITDASAVEARGKRQTIAIANDSTTYTASVYLAKTVGTPTHFPCLNLRMTGGTLVDAYVVVNTTTGALFDSVISTASAESVGDFWRVALTVANNASGNTSALVSVYPAWRRDLTATDLDVTTTGAATFWGAQFEAASAPTSYIPTTATAETRAADTGGLAATTTGFTRNTGSFLTDGFRVGMEVTPTGFTSSTVGTIQAVTALSMTVTGTRTADSASGGRTLAVNLPASAAWLNVPHEPTAQTPWVEEQYLPGSAEQWTVTTTGLLEVLPQYALTLYLPTGGDASAAFAYADAMLDHFAPGTPLTLADGTDLRVRARPAPYPSPLQVVDGAWAALTVTVPLRHITPNSR